MNEDISSDWKPSSKGDMVKESNHTCKVVNKNVNQGKKKKQSNKCPRPTEEPSVNEEGEGDQRN